MNLAFLETLSMLDTLREGCLITLSIACRFNNPSRRSLRRPDKIYVADAAGLSVIMVSSSRHLLIVL